MLHHHLPQLISQLASLGRHAVGLCHAATRMVTFVLYRLELSRNAGRAAFRTIYPRQKRKPKNRATIRRPPPLLIHYHIFKNAGTSFEWALEQALGSGLQRLDTPYHDGFISRRDIAQHVRAHPEAEATTTHQAAAPASRIRGRDIITSVLIRDPIARIRSIYAFERWQQCDIPRAVKPKKADFKEHVEWRLATIRGMFCNFQVHFCCRSGSKSDPPLNDVELEKTITGLDAIDIVGIAERYDEWLALAQSFLAKRFEGISLLTTRQNALVTDRHRLPEPAIVVAGARSERAITI